MGKQKMVLKVTMEDSKKRAKALKTAVGLRGVMSAQVDGDKVVVVGNGVDSVTLAIMLRKKMGYAELVSVSAVEEKKDEKKDEKKEKKEEKKEDKKEDKKDKAPEVLKYIEPVVWPYQVTMQPQPYMYHTQTRDPYYNDESCCIM